MDIQFCVCFDTSFFQGEGPLICLFAGTAVREIHGAKGFHPLYDAWGEVRIAVVRFFPRRM